MKKTQATNVCAIRGATTADGNTADAIRDASAELYLEMLLRNPGIVRIVSVVISTTGDLTAVYPAKAIREAGCSAPLFSCLEPPIDDSLPSCIRILLTAETSGAVSHTYLKGAVCLRPDLIEGGD